MSEIDTFNKTITCPVDLSGENIFRFRKQLESLINSHSLENGSDTPDFILAEYLLDCLAAFDKATNKRTAWHTAPNGACRQSIKDET